VRAADEDRDVAVVVEDMDFEGLRTFMLRAPLVAR
jgi:hypothetical protein